MLPASDAELVRIVDAALADATVRGGAWLACRPGCNQCCTGVFRISPLDGERLREGLRQLSENDPQRAAQVSERALQSARRLEEGFPGDALTGVLDGTAEADTVFEDFANDEVCPVLDPLTGTCDLYAFRPMTCRTFGPPVRTDEGWGVCELCFIGATAEAIQAAEMRLPLPEMESRLSEQAEVQGESVVTFALARRISRA